MPTYQEQIEKRRLEREAKEKAEAASKLSPDQVSNWRIVLANMGIPFAMSMPEEMVQRFRDALQARVYAEYPKRHDDISRPDGKQHEPQHGPKP